MPKTTGYTGPFDGARPNSQPIHKVEKTPQGGYLVHSIFATIQGEGPFCGRPAVFLRLAGCNLQCPFCDTEYTAGSFRADISFIVGAIRYERAKAMLGPNADVEDVPHGGLVVITGGEPFRQNLTLLLTELYRLGYVVQIETNGTMPPPEPFQFLYRTVANPAAKEPGIYVVISPKTGKVHKDLAARACAYKYVLDLESGVDPDDGLPTKALGHVANPRLARPPSWWAGPVYLQPADLQDADANAANTAAAMQSCQQHGYVLQLQIHKYLGVE